jgi:hypothetical protein
MPRAPSGLHNRDTWQSARQPRPHVPAARAWPGHSSFNDRSRIKCLPAQWALAAAWNLPTCKQCADVLVVLDFVLSFSPSLRLGIFYPI